MVERTADERALADPAAVPPLPRGRGRAAQRAPRLRGRAARPRGERAGAHHALALRPVHVGRRRAGLAQAFW